jgi:hypothetical protein
VAAGLPETIRVKLSSEDAGGVSLTPVVSRDMRLAELVELMLDVTGRDAPRLQSLLVRGSLVVGATRYRWAAVRATAEQMQELLAGLPDDEPQRPFAPERCTEVWWEGPGFRMRTSSQALARRRFFHRRSFWDVLAEAARISGARYAGFHHREQADRYVVDVGPDMAGALRRHASLLNYRALEWQIRGAACGGSSSWSAGHSSRDSGLI